MPLPVEINLFYFLYLLCFVNILLFCLIFILCCLYNYNCSIVIIFVIFNIISNIYFLWYHLGSWRKYLFLLSFCVLVHPGMRYMVIIIVPLARVGWSFRARHVVVARRWLAGRAGDGLRSPTPRTKLCSLSSRRRLLPCARCPTENILFLH